MAALARSGSSFLVVSVANLSIRPRSRNLSLPSIASSIINRKNNNHGSVLRLSSFPPLFCVRSSTTTTTQEPGGEAYPYPPAEGEETEDPDPIREAANLLDVRVGHVLRAWRHPEADSLYVEEVDVGEPEPRTICSGLVNYMPLDRLQDSKVIVLANLKPRNMRGIKSNGMLMAASNASHEVVEILMPPEGSVPGERIWFGGEEEKDKQADAASPNQVQKKKIWELVQPHLKTTDTCVAVLGAHPMRTAAGVVTCASLKNANIS